MEEEEGTNLESAVKAISHYGDEFLVAKVAVSVNVEKLEHSVDELVIEVLTGAHLHRSLKFLCGKKERTHIKLLECSYQILVECTY